MLVGSHCGFASASATRSIRAATKASADGTLTAAGDFEWINKRWQAATGIAETDLGNERLKQIVYPEDLERYVERRALGLERGVAFEVEVRLKHIAAPESDYRWHLTRIIPIRDERGTIVR